MWYVYIRTIHPLGADKFPCVLKILSLDDYDIYIYIYIYRRVYDYTTCYFSGFLVTTFCPRGCRGSSPS